MNSDLWNNRIAKELEAKYNVQTKCWAMPTKYLYKNKQKYIYLFTFRRDSDTSICIYLNICPYFSYSFLFRLLYAFCFVLSVCFVLFWELVLGFCLFIFVKYTLSFFEKKINCNVKKLTHSLGLFTLSSGMIDIKYVLRNRKYGNCHDCKYSVMQILSEVCCLQSENRKHCWSEDNLHFPLSS